MPADLTPAEQAAAIALWNMWTPLDGEPSLSITDFYDEARAAIAAGGPHVFAGALEEAADDLQQRLKTAPDAATGLLRVGRFIGDLRDRAAALRDAKRQAEGGGPDGR